MSSIGTSRRRRAGEAQAMQILRQLVVGFAFWATFLIVLEPGNIVRAASNGTSLTWGQEALRILTASLLAALTAPLQFYLVRRYPFPARKAAFVIARHLAANACIAAGLLLVAFLLAPLVLAESNPWLAVPLADQFNSNVLLMVFALSSLTLLAHLARDARSAVTSAGNTAHLTRIAVRGRQGTILVNDVDIDWIESQDNYAALHVASKVLLTRETLTDLAQKLNPELFLRIHRRVIVNVTRLQGLKPLSNGDVRVYLSDGTELRSSRTFGEQLRARFSSMHHDTRPGQ